MCQAVKFREIRKLSSSNLIYLERKLPGMYQVLVKSDKLGDRKLRRDRHLHQPILLLLPRSLKLALSILTRTYQIYEQKVYFLQPPFAFVTKIRNSCSGHPITYLVVFIGSSPPVPPSVPRQDENRRDVRGLIVEPSISFTR